MADERLPVAGLPAKVRRLMAEVGPRWSTNIQYHAKLMADAFTPLLRMAPRDGVEVLRDLAYGEHPRQRLDVFRPPACDDAPVLVFFHGGAFVRGERNVTEEIYGNVTLWFARQGTLAVNAGYRLAPEYRWPSGAEDVASVVRWTRANAPQWGGDPDRIVLMGHSAGGAHVACYAYDPRLHPPGGPEVGGIILVSARLRAASRPDDPNADAIAAYFGADPADQADRSPVTHARKTRVPTFVAIAEFENPFLDLYAEETVAELARGGKTPRFARAGWHNHLSIVDHFNTGDEVLPREILAFVRELGKAAGSTDHSRQASPGEDRS